MTRRGVAGVAVVLACLAVSGCAREDGGSPGDGPSGGGPVPGAPTGATVRQAGAWLSELTVRPWRSMRGYSRKRFDHWASRGDGCNVRELVLQRDGQGVRTDEECRAVSGRWESPYDGRVHTSAEEVDIDHMVPLANAWRSGADGWDDRQRELFANDMTRPQLFAVTASTNRAKGDQSPEAWKPPRVSYWCTYARNWITVKHFYQLSVTVPEREALGSMLDGC
jgi:hypothetical protein